MTKKGGNALNSVFSMKIQVVESKEQPFQVLLEKPFLVKILRGVFRMLNLRLISPSNRRTGFRAWL